MTHEPGSIRARLHTSIDTAWGLYCALEVAIPHRQTVVDNTGGGGKRKPSVSTIPWNSVAAGLTLEFHSKVRSLESGLNEQIVGATKHRGSSTANTRYAIAAIDRLCVMCDDTTVLGVLGYFDSWSRRADAVFNPENGLYRLPRQPGDGEARCPYCQYQTMRWHPARGQAVCVNPGCRNQDGQRPRWSAEFTVLGGQLVFRWEEMEDAA